MNPSNPTPHTDQEPKQPSQNASQASTFGFYYLRTLKDIVGNHSLFTTLILSVLIYSFFYPAAYKAEHAELLPIIVVDEEQSQISNTIIQAVSQSHNVEIKSVLNNFQQAEDLIKAQQADGILLLPSNLSNSLYRGEVGGIGLYMSATNFLKTQKITLGLAASLENALKEQANKYQISAFHPALSIHQIPLFNTLSGYGSYVFPAVAPLIVHQTLLLGTCMLIASYRLKSWRPSKTEYGAIFSALSTIGCLACLYLFGFSFWFNDYPHGGNFWGMLLAVPIFISCVVAMAMFIASFLDLPERAGHVIVFTSIPLFMLTGTAWPHAAMPGWIQFFANLLPSTQSIQMFIQLNQMGVPTFMVGAKLIYIGCLTGIFVCLSFYRFTVK